MISCQYYTQSLYQRVYYFTSIQFNMKLHEFHCTIGILRSNWYNSKQQLVRFNYGTAIAINKRILLTCTHNICSEHNKDYASEIIFITDVADGKITPRTNRYKSIPGQFYRTQTPNSIYNKRPIKEQLTLIILRQPLDAQNFLKVGSISPSQLQNEMKVIGFPSLKYISTSQLNSIQIQRIQSTGELYQPQNMNLNSHIVDYTMRTAVGMSGGPVLIKQDDGNYKIVGIHTHRGLTSNYNSGLFFNTEILHKIKQWVQQIESEYEFECGPVFCRQSENISTIDTSYQIQQYSSLLYIEESQHHSQFEWNQLCEQYKVEEDENKLQMEIFNEFYNQIYQQYFYNDIYCELRLSNHEERPWIKQYAVEQCI